MASKEIFIVETIRGQIEASKLTPDGICLFHERLTPTVYPVSCERPMTIQHLEYHRGNLLSLENTAITPGMIDHELQVLLQKINKSSTDVVLLDGSSYEAKVPELLEKYVVVKGYQYRLAGSPSESQKNVLLSKEHILKQLEYQFKLGNGKFKPGFIGQLSINDCLQGSSYFNSYKAYLEFSAKTNCFITINTLQLGSKCVHHHLKVSNTSVKAQYLYKTFELIKKIQAILQTALDAKVKKIVIYNIPFIFETMIDEKFAQTTWNIVHQSIMNLFHKYDCYFGFDLSRYSQSKESLYYIGQLMTLFSNRILLSGCLTYKTDLTTFSGAGYLYYKGEKMTEISSITNDSLLKDVLHTNKLRLLAWKMKVQEEKIIVLWKCSQCGGEQPQTVESFRKFGKQFCSIKCLKSHKF